MKKFDFRLQKVLEYRAMLEQWAKEAYLDARTARLEAEMVLLHIAEARQEAIAKPVSDGLEGLKELELRIKRYDEKQTEQQIVVNVLANEEEQALEAWTERKVELEALQRMYDKQYAEWQLEVERKLQSELDEWALRKKIA